MMRPVFPADPSDGDAFVVFCVRKYIDTMWRTKIPAIREVRFSYMRGEWTANDVRGIPALSWTADESGFFVEVDAYDVFRTKDDACAEAVRRASVIVADYERLCLDAMSMLDAFKRGECFSESLHDEAGAAPK